MTDPWDDPGGLLPPLTLEKALKAARKAKASRLIYRGVEFDLTSPEPAKISAEEPPRVEVLRINPKRKVVL